MKKQKKHFLLIMIALLVFLSTTVSGLQYRFDYQVLKNQTFNTTENISIAGLYPNATQEKAEEVGITYSESTSGIESLNVSQYAEGFLNILVEFNATRNIGLYNETVLINSTQHNVTFSFNVTDNLTQEPASEGGDFFFIQCQRGTDGIMTNCHDVNSTQVKKSLNITSCDNVTKTTGAIDLNNLEVVQIVDESFGKDLADGLNKAMYDFLNNSQGLNTCLASLSTERDKSESVRNSCLRDKDGLKAQLEQINKDNYLIKKWIAIILLVSMIILLVAYYAYDKHFSKQLS